MYAGILKIAAANRIDGISLYVAEQVSLWLPTEGDDFDLVCAKIVEQHNLTGDSLDEELAFAEAMIKMNGSKYYLKANVVRDNYEAD